MDHAIYREPPVRESSRLKALKVFREGPEFVREWGRRARLWSRVADDYKSLPENKQRPGRALSADEERKLFAIANSIPTGSPPTMLWRTFSAW